MVEGLLAHDAGDRFEVESAGDNHGHPSKHLEEFQGESFD
jgi:hypothetical protein